MPCVTEKVAAKRKQLVEWDIYKATDHQNFLSAKDMGDSDPKPFGTLRNPFDKYHNQEGVNIGYTCELKDSTCKTGARRFSFFLYSDRIARISAVPCTVYRARSLRTLLC